MNSLEDKDERGPGHGQPRDGIFFPPADGSAADQPAAEATDPLSAEIAACLARLAAGDLAARDRIIEVCAGRLRTLAHRMLARFSKVRRWNDTDDVFQNAALRLHRTLGQMQLDSPRSVLALAATQVRRELVDLARRYSGPTSHAANHGTNVFAHGVDTDSGSPRGAQRVDLAPAAEDDEDRWTQFHEAIDSLPPDEREVFHLVWYLGADQKTIAGLLDCSERTVKYRWRAAREAIKTALDGRRP